MIPIRVLIVEDSEDDYELLLVLLREGGFAPSALRVETAAELGEALRDDSWQAVISDYNLPGFNGLAALRMVRAVYPDLPFIVVSGAIDEAEAVAAMRAGAQDYLFKGKLARLVPAVRRELDDAGERRKGREEMRAALLREQQLHRLKSGFVSIVSHEFRTPLGVISLATDILARYGDRMDSEARLRQTNEIRGAVERMLALMEDVLLSGKIEAGKMPFKPELFDLTAWCAHCRDQILLSTRDRNPIDLSFQDIPEQVFMDRSLIQIILNNLLSNAVKFSAEGQKISMEVSARQHPDPEIRFRVIDCGIGIPAEDLPDLCESFHRGRNAGSIAGTGLGLAIAKRCITLHNGDIAVESSPGRTVFTVRLPDLLPRGPLAAVPGQSARFPLT